MAIYEGEAKVIYRGGKFDNVYTEEPFGNYTPYIEKSTYDELRKDADQYLMELMKLRESRERLREALENINRQLPDFLDRIEVKEVLKSDDKLFEESRVQHSSKSQSGVLVDDIVKIDKSAQER